MPGDYQIAAPKWYKKNGWEEMPYWFDGNNLIGQSTARATIDRTMRREFLSHLSRRSQSQGGRFLVYFDGDDPDRAMPPPGVKVRFSAPVSADDAILQDIAAAGNPAEIIVVTNDRSFATRTRDLGARSITWAQFDSKRKPDTGGRKLSSDAPVDLEDWMRYFGVDNDKS
jgi:hypothetical protein